MKRFKPTRRKNGGFGHCTAKYRKHPVVVHNMKLQAERGVRRPRLIDNPASSVRDLIERRK